MFLKIRMRTSASKNIILPICRRAFGKTFKATTMFLEPTVFQFGVNTLSVGLRRFLPVIFTVTDFSIVSILLKSSCNALPISILPCFNILRKSWRGRGSITCMPQWWWFIFIVWRHVKQSKTQQKYVQDNLEIFNLL